MPTKKKTAKKAAKKASPKAAPRAAKPKAAQPGLPDEEIAYRLVGLYFQEIARMGFKRKLNLDAIINAYFYSLKRLQNKELELAAIERIVRKEEEVLATETKQELFPVFGEAPAKAPRPAGTVQR